MAFPPINLWNSFLMRVHVTENKEKIMGVSYRPVLAIGAEFEDASECVDLLRHLLSADDLLTIGDEGDSFISELTINMMYRPAVKCLNLYSGYGWYVGFDLSVRDVEKFSENVADAIQKWNEMFPDVPAQIIHTVRVS